MTDIPDSAASPDIASLSFEAAMGELETIVRRLESGDVSLEESVALYERRHALRGPCEARLAADPGRLEQVGLGTVRPTAGNQPLAHRRYAMALPATQSFSE